MPKQTVIDLSTFTAAELEAEIRGLQKDRELARCRVAQVAFDIQHAKDELAKRQKAQPA